jgi:hypothetical protein
MSNEQYINNLLLKFAAAKQANEGTIGFKTLGGQPVQTPTMGPIDKYNPGRIGDLLTDVWYGGAGPLSDTAVEGRPDQNQGMQAVQTVGNAIGNAAVGAGLTAAAQKFIPTAWHKFTNPHSAVFREPINQGTPEQIQQRLTARGMPSDNIAISGGTQPIANQGKFEPFNQENITPAKPPIGLNSQQLSQALEIQRIVPTADLQMVSEMLSKGADPDDVLSFIKMRESGIGDPNLLTTDAYNKFLAAKGKNPNLTFMEHSGQVTAPPAPPTTPNLRDFLRFDKNGAIIMDPSTGKPAGVVQFALAQQKYQADLAAYNTAKAQFDASIMAETNARQAVQTARAKGVSGGSAPAVRFTDLNAKPDGKSNWMQRTMDLAGNSNIDPGRSFLSMRNTRSSPWLPILAGVAAPIADRFLSRGSTPRVGIGTYDSGPGTIDEIDWGAQGPVNAFGYYGGGYSAFPNASQYRPQ